MEPSTTQPAAPPAPEALAAPPAPAEIVVAIPTFNNAATAGEIAAAAQEALKESFSGRPGAVIHADGGSTDGTSERVSEAAGGDHLLCVAYRHPAQKLMVPYHGVPGKASAYRVIFETAQKLHARVCVVLDPDLRGITAEWVASLVRPVLEHHYDFVAPQYARHKFDGALGSGIIYPLMRTLYGKRLRQPLGSDFAFSSNLMADLLEDDAWITEDAQAGADIAVVTRAVSGPFRVCQARLGPKVPYTRDLTLDISSVLVQVVGAVYHEMDRNVAIWQKIRGSESVPVLGEPHSAGVEPPPADIHKMVEQFRFGSQNLLEVWGLVLPPATLVELKRIARGPAEPFLFPDETWARTIYDFALGYRLRVINRDHLLRALTPLYLGWVASLVSQLRDASMEQVEARIEKLCLVYESMKPYLISRWRWPDRFNP